MSRRKGSIDDTDILDALDLKRKRCVRKWTPEEDQEMIDMVMRHGTKMWGLIGSKLKDRTGKQCRERSESFLDRDARVEVICSTHVLILVSISAL